MKDPLNGSFEARSLSQTPILGASLEALECGAAGQACPVSAKAARTMTLVRYVLAAIDNFHDNRGFP